VQGPTPVTYVYAVIERAVLSNVDENRLVVRARVDAAHSERTGRQAGRYVGGQDAILGRFVETFEEREDVRVLRLGRLQRRKFLNDHVARPYNDPVVVDGLHAM
jgi:hypothetical protein